MEKLSKEQYALKNNLDPDLYESVEEISKWLNLRDKFQKHYQLIKNYEII